MATKEYIPLNTTPGQSATSPGTVFIERIGSETAQQAADRANSGAALSTIQVGAFVGDNSHSFSKTGTDYNNTAFVSTPSLRLIDTSVRTKPRLKGNDFAFPVQVGQNTLLLGRLPDFTVAGVKLIVYAGPNFSDTAERARILAKGFNALGESVPNGYQISRTQQVELLRGAAYKNVAAAALSGLSTSDPSYNWLVKMRDNNEFIDNQTACHLFAKQVFNTLNGSGRAEGQGVLGYCPDWEDASLSTLSGNDFQTQWLNFTGYLCEGVRLAAIEYNQAHPSAQVAIPEPVLYDKSRICQYTYDQWEMDQEADGTTGWDGGTYTYSDPEPGLPIYLHRIHLTGSAFENGASKSAPMGATNPLGAYLRDHGGYAGSAEYMRYPWHSGSFFKKDTNGNFLTTTTGGVTNFIYRDDAHTATIYGQQVPILTYDAKAHLNMVYLRLMQGYTDYYFRSGGKHMPKSTDVQSGWSLLKLLQWFRADLEFKSDNDEGHPSETDGVPVGLNHRPHQPEEIERDIIAQYFFRECIRFFDSPQSTLVQGAEVQQQQGSQVRAKGSWETVSKALYRASRFDWVFDVAHQFCCPYLYIRKQTTTKAYYDRREAFEKKPYLVPIIIPSYQGNTYLLLIWSYPALDETMSVELTTWVNKAGATTPGYKVIMTRGTGIDAWRIPAGFSDMIPSNWLFQFTDMTGEKQTVTGDYRDLIAGRITSHPNPPTLA